MPALTAWTKVWQIGDEEFPIEGLLSNYADEFNWGDPAGSTTTGPSLADDKPLFANPFIVGSSETGEFPYNANYNRGYGVDFDVEWDGALPWGGKLTLSWSPGQSALETKEVSIDGGVHATFTAQGTAKPGEGWFQDKYPLVQHTMNVPKLAYGTHTFNLHHTTGDGTFWDWIRLEQPVESETAWGAGCRFNENNWATYICDYTVGCPTCPSVTESSGNVDILTEPLDDVRAGVTTVNDPLVFAVYAGTDHGGFTHDV